MNQPTRTSAGPSPHWVLVANAARARCFVRDGRTHALKELASFVHPASRLKGAALQTERAGQVRKSAAQARLASRIDPHEKEHVAFARELAAYLEDAVLAHRCARVALIAPPDFLGELRAQLGTSTRHVLGAGIGLDLTTCDAAELEQRVTQALAVDGDTLNAETRPHAGKPPNTGERHGSQRQDTR